MAGPDRKQPCKGCPDRNETCHGRCKEYKEYQEEQRKKKLFLIRMNNGGPTSPAPRWSKSSNRYVAPKGIDHKK